MRVNVRHRWIHVLIFLQIENALLVASAFSIVHLSPNRAVRRGIYLYGTRTRRGRYEI